MPQPDQPASRALSLLSSHGRDDGGSISEADKEKPLFGARGRPRRRVGAAVHRGGPEKISYTKAANFVKALHHAQAVLARPPNVHVTIQWKLAGGTSDEMDRT